jgi:diguanylate cyclase
MDGGTLTALMGHPSDPRLAEIISALLRLAEGDFSAPLVASPRRDEIDAVMTGINYMADQLHSSYTELDQRVRERTRELAEARDAMHSLATSDHLTGLANRLALTTELEHRLAGFRRGEPSPCLICVDLDRFKAVNDTWGHQAGDQVLRVIAGRLGSAVRDGDLVARLGGDEFAILLAGTITEAEAHELCGRVRAAVNPALDVDGVEILPGASIGFTVAAAGDTADRLMHHADTAMYVSKRSGDGCPQAFRPWMLEKRRRETGIYSGPAPSGPEASATP